MVEKYLTQNPAQEIDKTISELDPDRVLIITDSNVEGLVIPLLKDSEVIDKSPRNIITPGEEHKDLETVNRIWEDLEGIGATRRSVVLNIGGGMVTDLGGFAASTFKRGLRTVNFPTTLLGAVDAATGGKTGINFKGLKNEIGTFHNPSKVIISTSPFRLLPKEEILSGYAEMIKTALISDKKFYTRLLDFDETIANSSELGKSVEKCIIIKEDIVEQDPREKGLRKVLNFGHTAGHAFESHRLEKGNPVTHGKAVAHGILVALILSHIKLGFSSMEIAFYCDFLKNHFGHALIKCDEINGVVEKMKSDKKNLTYGQPSFTLLREIGYPEIDCHASQSEIKESLDIYRDMLG